MWNLTTYISHKPLFVIIKTKNNQVLSDLVVSSILKEGVKTVNFMLHVFYNNKKKKDNW
jgi:hypothetical protein